MKLSSAVEIDLRWSRCVAGEPVGAGPESRFALVARALALSLALVGSGADLKAQPAGGVPPGPSAAKVVVSGVVPDEATRQALLAKVREVYGHERVVDQLGVGEMAAPPNWSELVQRLISSDLKRVSKGQLKVTGNVVELNGEVASDVVSQQLATQMSARLNPTYTVRNGLRVAAAGQEILDASLANRTVAFQPGNATLTPVGLRTLDDLLPVLARFRGRKFEVIGHTDAVGAPAQNQLLSAERAKAVKAYLVGRGIEAESILTSGAGAERPIASNDSPEGRAQNRRIEFRVLP